MSLMSTYMELGCYRVVATIATGVGSVIYKGHDPRNNRFITLKTPFPPLQGTAQQKQQLAALGREAELLGRLRHHHNIVTFHEFVKDNQPPFIVMEYLQGNNLQQNLASNKIFPVAKSITIFEQLLDALSHLEEHDIVHRDLKPGNIVMLAKDIIKISDFGIAAYNNCPPTELAAVAGTPSYMAPEQIIGSQVDGRSDLFSAGVIFYEMLCGRKPFLGASPNKITHNILTKPPPAPSSINRQLPFGFDPLLQQLLAKRPNQRFATAEAVKKAMQLLNP